MVSEALGASAVEVVQEARPSEGPPAVVVSESSSTSRLFNELSQIMTWRGQGLLSDGEFAEAKARLLRGD